jgi:Tfp pilus assembly protein PilX
MTMRSLFDRRQRGIALPIMLIMLTVMMVSSIYLLRSSTSTTMTTSNLAYDAALSKAADAGLHTAFTYLRTVVNKNDLLVDQTAFGYVATLPQNWTAGNPNFWLGAVTMAPDADGNRIQYVIHRMCNLTGSYDVPPNKCQTTAPRPDLAAPRQLGETLKRDANNLASAAQIHYVVTARVFGLRGGNVVTQGVVMKGP